MRRREFITLAGGAVACPVVARAQQAKMPVIGFLYPGMASNFAFVPSFVAGLKEGGFIDGQNLIIEYSWADNKAERLPQLAIELVRRKPSVIVASPGLGALAAKAATDTIPIVFEIATDAVKLGLVESYNRPGGNLTGVSQLSSMLGAKRLEILKQLVPGLKTCAVFLDPVSPSLKDQSTEILQAALVLSLEVILLDVGNDMGIDKAFIQLIEQHAGALLVGASSFLVNSRLKITEMAARYSIPAIYEHRGFATAGGLMSYGTDFMEVYRQVGIYASRILKGEKPSDLPVMQPTKFELVINLKTAKTLGFEIPPQLLAIADEVIE